MDPLRVGGQTTYTLRLLNPGKAAATRLGLTVTVPDRMKYLNATGPTAPAEEQQEIKFAPLATLGPGAEVVYTVTVRAESAGEAPKAGYDISLLRISFSRAASRRSTSLRNV